MNAAQSRLHFRLLGRLDIHSNEDRYRTYSVITGREITSSSQLTKGETQKVLDDLEAALNDYSPEDRLAQVEIWTRPVEDPWAKAS